MRPLLALALCRLQMGRNRLRLLRRGGTVKAAVVVLGMTAIGLLAYGVALSSFRFIEAFPAIGGPLNERLLSLFFLILLVMVGLSTAVVAYATLFLAAETEYLFQHPLPPRVILFSRLLESAALSAWATLFLGLPVLAAFGRVRHAPPAFYLEAGIALLIFLLFCGACGAALTLALLEAVRRWTWRRLSLCAMGLAGAGAWVFLSSFEFGGADGPQSIQALDRFARGLPVLSSPFFPGQWIASLVVSASGGLHREVLFHGGLLLANTVIWLPLFALYGRLRYSSRWLYAREPAQVRGRARAGAGRTDRQARWGGPLRSLVRKDLITFVRDLGQLTQFLLFVLLLAVYVASVLQIPRYLFGDGWKLVVHFANLGAVALILSSFSSRFLFPLLSLEGRSFWILGLAPLERTFLVGQKAFLGAVVLMSLGTAAALASTRFLALEPSLQVGGVFTACLIAACLSCLASGLGAAYPSLDEDNPARIAVGLGGTLNFFASAGAVTAILAIEGAPYLLAWPARPGWVPLAHVVALVFTASVSAYALRLGRRALEERDF